MKLILDTENSHLTTITVKGKEMTLLLIESSILIDSSQIAKLFDKKEKTNKRLNIILRVILNGVERNEESYVLAFFVLL